MELEKFFGQVAVEIAGAVGFAVLVALAGWGGRIRARIRRKPTRTERPEGYKRSRWSHMEDTW